MDKKKRNIMLCGVSVMALVCVIFVKVLVSRDNAGQSKNLALMKGVTASCDSVETEDLSADRAIDGDDESLSSRWSSENNWEDASHYIELEFPEEISVSFVILKWERCNAVSYALEGSLDGETWETLRVFDTAPERKNQEIVLEEAVSVRYLRMSVDEVSRKEEDYSNLYQNVSLYEFEVYADKPAAYLVEAPVIEQAADGSRWLSEPEAPEGYEVTFIGADLEQVIGADGTVYDTLQDQEVTVGYRVEDSAGEEEVREVSFLVEVPACEDAADGENVVDGEDAAVRRETSVNACPAVVPGVQEWKGGTGTFQVTEQTRVIVDVPLAGAAADAETEADVSGPDGERAQELMDTALLLAEQYCGMTGCIREDLAEVSGTGSVGGSGNESVNTEESGRYQLEICEGTIADLRPGDIYLGYAEEANGLGEEGYTCDITDTCVIKAESSTGLRWGTVTLLQMLFPAWQEEIYTVSQEESGGEADNAPKRQPCAVPQGRIRDYPLYEVRGFGIDVARKEVPLAMLYQIVETMSWYKMNDLTIHLNDNEILSNSGLTDSVENAMTAYSAFRLESELTNEDGERLTAQDYSYSRKEFAELIAAAKDYGVTVVPEIDTPAHSLAITKLFPEYALTGSVESVDQIDLHNTDAVEFVKEIWREALDGTSGAFREAQIVGIGMDEYYGDGEEYRQFLVEINELVQSAGKTARLWGSLSNVGGTTVPGTENLQMSLWSMVWADPREMYEAGYSIINMQNNHLYIIPGGGYDYLDEEDLRRNWEPNKFYDYNEMEIVPSYSPQMLGAAYMIWNDRSRELGIGEAEMYERFVRPIEVIAGKLWQ